MELLDRSRLNCLPDAVATIALGAVGPLPAMDGDRREHFVPRLDGVIDPTDPRDKRCHRVLHHRAPERPVPQGERAVSSRERHYGSVIGCKRATVRIGAASVAAALIMFHPP